jgi:short-subunit dehydrogenase
MPISSTSNRPLAVVTGASSGIGFELARQFAQNGFDLLIAADSAAIERAAVELGGLGAGVKPVQVNLAEHDGTHQLINAIEAAGRPVEAVAINAGVGVSGRFLENSLHDEMNMVRLNVMSTLHLTKYMAQHMVKNGKGRILITSSIAGTMPTPFEAVYGATKAFDRSLGQSIREELKDTGVTVTVLMPGATDTKFFERAGALDTKLGASEDKDDPAQVAKEGFDAMMAGEDHVIAGSLKNKFQAMAGYVLPDPLVAKGHAAMSAPGSAAKR